MNKIIFTILLFVFCSLNLFAQSEIAAQEYDFYKNYIDQKFVINRNTLKLDSIYFKDVKKKLRGIPKELLNDFLTKNAEVFINSEKLKSYRFTDDPKPNFDTDKELVFIFDAIVNISRVGFTKDGKQALVYTTEHTECCSGCFAGVVWLKVENNKWITKKYFQTVIC